MDWNGILDKVKTTSSNAYDKARDTTKRLATISELKSKIKGYNNDKNKLFTQMGMDIYIAEKNGSDSGEQIAEFVKKIDTLNVRIAKLEEKLKLIDSSDSSSEVDNISGDIDNVEEDDVKNAEDTESTDNTDNDQSTGDAESAENAKSAGNTESTENAENTGNTESADDKKSN